MSDQKRETPKVRYAVQTPGGSVLGIYRTRERAEKAWPGDYHIIVELSEVRDDQ